MLKHCDTDINRLDELRLQRELKEVILEYVHILYTAKHHSNHGFAILVCRHDFEREQVVSKHSRDKEYLTIRAIVYTEPGRRSFQLLAQSSKGHFGIIPALQEFTKELEREMGDMTATLSLGQKRKTGGESRLEEGGREERRRRLV
ncbi:uncharacterized protein K460DRAFT_420656 [Cucurbitaria berberidis CBS 394.84]|uniref:Uncharacterized protein n=1 Tax=Cucurbitaria berberidis CBS 394.84 TaxID=1168544 RepID=A0A9P4L3V3_9PLEO|nr:uncharacterized protein K460DRAFT_420656 [Cucurbitaria berberidis CBS 394.84]KAF1840785.1 hypothetical protein K460DRAFT_420656 [Cucurbitaria berberidis CBS 394.84]